MASVAICPHCYLQLVIPDGVEPEERVECPTCAKEFGINQAVVRAIPEVVRRTRPSIEQAAAKPAPVERGIEAPGRAEVDDVVVEEVVVEEVAEVVGRDENAADSAEPNGADILEQIKVRIDREIAAGNLLPGMSTSLPLETPSGLDDLASLPQAESELLDEWHRPTVRVHDLTTGDDTTLADHDPADVEVIETDEQIIEANDDSFGPIVAESTALSDYVADADAGLENELAGQAHDETPAVDELVPESEQVSESVEAPIEPFAARPSATTLADLMPPIAYEPPREELADAPGPSFELPNVPLTPPNSATVEFDPSMTFGPAAESEFELEHVDFESTPMEEPVSDDFATESHEDSSETDEPVFREPTASPIQATPFVLPGLPRPRKKRRVMRTLVGTVAGAMFGILAAIYILLFLRGPDGDIFGVAQFLPDAVLPTSFSAESRPVVARNSERPQEESANVPATFTEDVKQPEDSTAAEEPAGDERYRTEPSPLDEPAAEPIAEAVSAATLPPLPIRGPHITVDELATALDAGKAAQAGLLTGDLSDATVRRTKGMSYAKLCDLAEALTFVDRSALSVESEQAIEDAKRLFGETLSDAHTREEVDRIATIWIESPHRQHGGVFLAGSLSGGDIAGDVYEYQLTTGDGKKLELLSAEPLDPLVKDSQRPVGIVGSIVAHAADVTGYDGTAERAIWVTQAIPLE
jgi:hypothetical protein